MTDGVINRQGRSWVLRESTRLTAELPRGCGKRPYEIMGERVIVHDRGREIQIKICDEPIRHLGSLDLPMEEITLKFIDYSEADADKFVEDFVRPLQR